jgi:hypothetical protein
MSIHLDDASLSELQSRRLRFEYCLRDEEVQDTVRSFTDTCHRRPRLATCPCCGYPTLRERRAWETCCICHWEDDGQDDLPYSTLGPDEVAGGPNGNYSLTEARSNFIHFRTYHRSNGNASSCERGSWPTRERIVRVYEALLPKVDPVAYLAALPRVNSLFARLYEITVGKPYPGARKTKAWYAAERVAERLYRSQMRERFEERQRSKLKPD